MIFYAMKPRGGDAAYMARVRQVNEEEAAKRRAAGMPDAPPILGSGATNAWRAALARALGYGPSLEQSATETRNSESEPARSRSRSVPPDRR
jgi:hypothetical protein